LSAERSRRKRTGAGGFEANRHPTRSLGIRVGEPLASHPHNDMPGDRRGDTVTCEIWRSAHVRKSTTEIQYDAGHGTFTTVFPDGFADSRDPWLMNSDPPGGLRDGEYTVIWRSVPEVRALAQVFGLGTGATRPFRLVTREDRMQPWHTLGIWAQSRL
jgi:hypothetical protein